MNATPLHPSARRRPHSRGLAGIGLAIVLVGGSAAVSQDAPPETPPTATPATEPTVLPAAPAATPPPASVTDEYAEFRRRYEARDYAGAVAPARRVLELTEQHAQAPTDEDVQVALMNLALAEAAAGDFVAAEVHYLRAIELAEHSGRTSTDRLARANAGLASAYHAAKRYELAAPRFETAIAMSRRQEGLLNLQQVPLLEKYVDALTHLQRYDDALQAQKYVLRIATRTYGEQDPRIVPTLERIGRWYATVGAYDAGRRILKRAITIVEEAAGGKSPELIGPLVALADCNRRQLLDPNLRKSSSPDAARSSQFHDQLPSYATLPSSPNVLVAEGENALLRAAALAEQRTDPSPLQVADIRTQLGDWFQMRAQSERALPHYRQAWRVASQVDEKHSGRTLVEVLFGKPVLLYYVPPESWDRYSGRPPEEVEVLSLTVEIEVDAKGYVQGAKVTDDTGDPKRAEKTVQATETARYRPRFENGEPVATTGIVFTQQWFVLVAPETPPASETPTGEPPAATPPATHSS